MHLIKICQADSCRKNFAESSLKRAEEVLGIKAGESTPDGKIKLEICGCLSNCEQGPNVFIGQAESPLSMLLTEGKVENHMTPKALEQKLSALKDS